MPVLKDVADPSDPTLIGIHEWWPLGEEAIPKLGLHLHGDNAARSEQRYLMESIGELRSSTAPLTLAELGDHVQAIAAARNLESRVTKTRCASDPLEVAFDVSVWQS
jgi:hypothetical protein